MFSFASTNDGKDQKNATFNVPLPTLEAARNVKSSVGTAGNAPAPEVNDTPAKSSTAPAVESALASDLDTSTIRPSGDGTARVEGTAAEAADKAEEHDGLEEVAALEEDEEVEDESEEEDV